MDSKCRLSEFVDAFVHDELDHERKSEFEAHLVSCSACAREVDTMKTMKKAMEEAHEVKLDATFDYAVVNSIRTGQHIRPAKEIRIALEDIVISLATMLAIVLLGIQLFNVPKVTAADMVGSLTNVEQSSMEQTSLSNDQVLELVMRSK